MPLKKSSKLYPYIKFFQFIFFIFLFFILVFVFFTYFKITNIEVVTNNKKYNLLGTELLINRNLLLNPSSEIHKLILDRNPQIENLKIYKTYPKKLIIKFSLSKPIAEIRANNGYFLLSEKGKIIQKNKAANKNIHPKIHYYQKFDYLSHNIGDYIDNKDLIYAISFVLKIRKVGMSVDSIDITSPNMIRLLLNSSVVYLTTEKDIETQNNQLVKIIEQFKVEGKSFSSIDLRFDKPIIKLR
jgi:cell division septal protein FtsQ